MSITEKRREVPCYRPVAAAGQADARIHAEEPGLPHVIEPARWRIGVEAYGSPNELADALDAPVAEPLKPCLTKRGVDERLASRTIGATLDPREQAERAAIGIAPRTRTRCLRRSGVQFPFAKYGYLDVVLARRVHTNRSAFRAHVHSGNTQDEPAVASTAAIESNTRLRLFFMTGSGHVSARCVA